MACGIVDLGTSRADSMREQCIQRAIIRNSRFSAHVRRSVCSPVGKMGSEGRELAYLQTHTHRRGRRSKQTLRFRLPDPASRRRLSNRTSLICYPNRQVSPRYSFQSESFPALIKRRFATLQHTHEQVIAATLTAVHNRYPKLRYHHAHIKNKSIRWELADEMPLVFIWPSRVSEEIPFGVEVRGAWDDEILQWWPFSCESCIIFTCFPSNSIH